MLAYRPAEDIRQDPITAQFTLKKAWMQVRAGNMMAICHPPPIIVYSEQVVRG